MKRQTELTRVRCEIVSCKRNTKSSVARSREAVNVSIVLTPEREVCACLPLLLYSRIVNRRASIGGIRVNLFSNRSSARTRSRLPGSCLPGVEVELRAKRTGRRGGWRINHKPQFFHVMLMTPPASCVRIPRAQDAKVQAGTARRATSFFFLRDCG